MGYLLLISLSFFAFSQEVVFTAMGDTGKDNSGQAIIAQTLTDVCRLERCDFNLLLGDNFYQEGIESENDSQFYDKFEKHYQQVNIPFYITLGNHDYGSFANDYSRGEYQLLYSLRNPQFVLPNFFYTFEKKNVLFIALDTTRLVNGKDTAEQEEMFDAAIKNTKAKWVVVFGHHPYMSNGKHGNAGTYDGVFFPPSVSGARFKKFVERLLCGKVDAYYSGHDHSLQLLSSKSKCGMELIVSGAGASATKLSERNPYHYMINEIGFVMTKVYSDKMVLDVIGQDGSSLYTHEISK